MFYMFILPSINFHLPHNSNNPKRERESTKLPPSLRLPSLCMLRPPVKVTSSSLSSLFLLSLYFSLFPSDQPRLDRTLCWVPNNIITNISNPKWQSHTRTQIFTWKTLFLKGKKPQDKFRIISLLSNQL